MYRQKFLTKSPVAKSVDAVTPVVVGVALMLVTAKMLTTNFGGDATVAFTPRNAGGPSETTIFLPWWLTSTEKEACLLTYKV